MSLPKIVSTKIVSPFKTDDRVRIKSIDRSFMGPYLHQYCQKFKGTTARVEKVINGKKTFNVLIQPHGYESFIFMAPNELEKY